MPSKYTEYKSLDLAQIGREIGEFWQKESIFEKSVDTREGKQSFTFYEGPPSANGLPGIHHVMARAIKDIFCRYKTLKGFQVKRKGGWDTHGLPIELSVEKTLGITKEDIGTKITIEDYNKACRKEVMKYKNVWDDLTRKMGYWVDLDDPYITFDNKYIESVWYLLNELYKKGLLYKGHTIQPYSPAAGTGLSSHELNMPGTYKDVKDTTVVAQFKAVQNAKSARIFKEANADVYFIAWTTTPWTLPSNTALAVGKKIEYVLVQTFNQYTSLPVNVIIAKDLMPKYFSEDNAGLNMADYKEGDKKIPYKVLDSFKGSELENIEYEQLLAFAQPSDGEAFRVLLGDFVSTEDGTGIVHLAPSFGSDDYKVAKQNGIGSLTLVDKKGKFVDEAGEFAGRYVKNYSDDKDYVSVDIDIAVKLKKENKAYKVEKYEHNYPHCWRTDKPILYYPLDSWFVKTTAFKDRMLELNNTINWKPASTGTGRFGNWLENLVDWNLSRSRFWGIPLPIWTSEDKEEQISVGSVEELQKYIYVSVEKGVMNSNPLANKSDYDSFDLHRPYVDDIVLVSKKGTKLFREKDLIDVWFDSGAMPYAQWHYPFENKEKFESAYPADFIAEGVDQTRGWFFTLHAIATILFDSVAYKNVVSNGLVLDKNGNKMSKRLGNAADPFKTIDTYGPDATRWYLISNAQPWDNLKFNEDGIVEVQRKFLGTLYNTYSFFALYANIDGFSYSEEEIAINDKPEIDRWIISLLNSLVKKVDTSYEAYEPTQAARAIQEFVNDDLSNWYVRLCRRRFWKGDYTADKISAYQTLYTCLNTVAHLMSPIAPFYADKLFIDLNTVSGKNNMDSIHLSNFPNIDETVINKELEERMHIAQEVSSLVLSLRRKERIKVRQPLNKILVPVLDNAFQKKVEAVKDIILTEVNVKNIEFITDTSGIMTKKIKPNFKVLGPKVGGAMKQVAAQINAMTQEDIQLFEKEGSFSIKNGENVLELGPSDAEIVSEDIQGWQVANSGKLTVALDVTIDEELKQEGLAREIVNRIQNLRKDKGFEVTDKINIQIQKHDSLNKSISNNKDYICNEILANTLELVDIVENEKASLIEVDENINTLTLINKIENGKEESSN
ncbi:MAG: isoleucine--tRNA ligase [Bacteroidia bacterium]|nr:isoleucine--tRNA ligase [Bacteroidia bacterium]